MVPGRRPQPRRWLPLDLWAVDALADHVLYLSRRVPADRLPAVHVLWVGPQGSRRRRPDAAGQADGTRQSEMVQLANRLLRKAGLHGLPGLRPMSLAEHTGALALARTGRLEAAAAVLGLASLDAAAAALRHPWRDAAALAPDWAPDAG